QSSFQIPLIRKRNSQITKGLGQCRMFTSIKTLLQLIRPLKACPCLSKIFKFPKCATQIIDDGNQFVTVLSIDSLTGRECDSEYFFRLDKLCPVEQIKP